MTPLTEDLDPKSPNPDDTAQATHFSRGTGGRILRAVVLLALALGLGFFFIRHQKTEAEARLSDATALDVAEAPAVDVVTVGQSSALQSLALPGETAAWDETNIYARVNGYVAKWFVDIGDRVTNGQTLATIDTPELDAELLAAKAKLNASVAQVAVKQAQADFAKTTDERWRESPKGVVSDQERESKKAGSAEAIAELNAARAQVLLEQADVDRLTALTQFKEVKAPFDGTIVQRQIDTGNLVTAGSTSNTSSLYRLSEDDPIRVFVHAPQSAAAQLMAQGVKAVITSSDQPSLHFEGKVARTAKAINPESRTLRVEIDIPNPDRTMVPGMYVQVAFDLKGGSQIQVPAAALLFRSGGPQVAVIDEKGVVAFRDVTIGSDEGNVVGISAGLAMGDRVALNLSSQIAAGEKVKLNEAKAGDTKSVAAQ
ncbi:efflux RND transporter periplasmic adaptor subunit [Methylocapsa sp. S129]|uniref:efflux RND transporter periplasmic adaptor subunit n=1 Tax=Methylocapsa sp. S129 TaxID=1641869 RepID=UPI00131BAF36|nr:efflux RND transporter periplasmic adaptor subunit [Methylocapsa sp. S129]